MQAVSVASCVFFSQMQSLLTVVTISDQSKVDLYTCAIANILLAK